MPRSLKKKSKSKSKSKASLFTLLTLGQYLQGPKVAASTSASASARKVVKHPKLQLQGYTMPVDFSKSGNLLKYNASNSNVNIEKHLSLMENKKEKFKTISSFKSRKPVKSKKSRKPSKSRKAVVKHQLKGRAGNSSKKRAAARSNQRKKGKRR